MRRWEEASTPTTMPPTNADTSTSRDVPAEAALSPSRSSDEADRAQLAAQVGLLRLLVQDVVRRISQDVSPP